MSNRLGLLLTGGLLALAGAKEVEGSPKDKCGWRPPEQGVVLAERCDIAGAVQTIVYIMDEHPETQEGLLVQRDNFAILQDLVRRRGSFPLVQENFSEKSLEGWIASSRGVPKDHPYRDAFLPLVELYDLPARKRPREAETLVGIVPVIASMAAAVAYPKDIRLVAPQYDKALERESLELLRNADEGLAMFDTPGQSFCASGGELYTLSQLIRATEADTLSPEGQDCFCGLLNQIEEDNNRGSQLRRTVVAEGEAQTALGFGEDFVVVYAGAAHALSAKSAFDAAGVNYRFVSAKSGSASAKVFTMQGDDVLSLDEIHTNSNGVNVCDGWTSSGDHQWLNLGGF
ncbi:MAG: hypothetical protein WC777_02090 [Candidatus Gracilibacteria bacterium]|jgi:hypothetical protein